MSDAATATLQRRYIPLEDLKIEYPGWVNPRLFTGLSDDEIDELAENLKKNKIEVPPSVVRVRHKDSEVNLVIDGQRRVLAARKVWPKDTRIEVIDLAESAIDPDPGTFAKLLRRALNIGNNRKGLSSYELTMAAKSLRDDGLKMTEIAAALDKSDTWCSKMLKALGDAIPSLLTAWKKGEITDEIFKDIASLDKDKQQAALNAARATREAGDKAGARTVVKEQVETKRQGVSKHPPVVNGPQADLFEKPEKESPPKPVAPPRAVLEDLVRMSEKTPPTHDYVKGLLDGVKYCLGFTSPEKFANAWVVYLRRFEGKAVPNSRRASAPPKKKSAKSGKARKPAKRGGKKGKR